MNKSIVNIISILLLTLLSIVIMWQESSFGITGVNSLRRLSLIPALLLAQTNKYALRAMFVLLVIYTFYSLTALTFGSVKTAFFVSAFETNTNESLEYFKTLPLLNYLIALSFLVTSVIYYKSAQIYILSNWIYKAGSILLLLLFTLLSWPGNQVRRALIFGLIYHEDRKTLIESINKADSWEVEINSRHNQYDNYILVIGESVRKDYLSVYGYIHPTTPWLNEVNGTFVDGYISMGFNTVSSLSRTLSQSVGDGMEFIPENNIMTLANKGGYDTYWISNQGRIGTYDTSTSTVAIRAKESVFMNKGSFEDANINDNEMLAHLQNILATKTANTNLIVLHMVGSHPDTCERLHGFPNNFNLEYGEHFNCYLATLEKTDHFLKQITEALSKQGSYSLVYFSDHGVSVKSDMVNVDGKIKNTYEVPFVVINSDDKEHLVVKRKVSGYNFTDIFANWLGLVTSKNTELYSLDNIEKIPEPNVILSNFSEEMVDSHLLPEQPVLK